MKKALTLLLVLTMLLSSFACMFTSCNDEEAKENDNPVTSEENKNNTNNDSGDIFAERAAVDDGLGDNLDFNGKTLRVVCHNDGYEMFPAEAEINKGDLIKDAKANRNLTVESRLNCNIELVYSADINTLENYVNKTVLSGTDEFDLVVNHVLKTGGMVTKNLFLNWYDIPKINFDQPWWAASNKTELTYDGKCIIAFSDINATSILSTCVLAFNKNLAASYDLGNLYDTVLNGEWTYDTFYEIVKDIYIDEDGSATRTTGDFYGAIFPVSNPTNAWLWAFNNPIMSKDEDGKPTISIKTDKINNIMQTLYDFYYNTTGVASQNNVIDEMEAHPADLFINKRSIFAPILLSHVQSQGLRNFEDDYGILPYPKWNEYQEDYISHVYGELTCLTVPKTAQDLEFIGTCVEALSAESWKTLTPTIYELALKTRYLRDSESKEVLDIVLDNRFFDFGFVYDNWQGFAYTPMRMIEAGSYNFESYYSKQFSKANIHFKKVLKAFDKLS